MPLRVLLTGVRGRMGQTLVERVQKESDLTLVGGTERGEAPSFPAPLFSGLEEALAQTKPDVVVDYTSAEASEAHAKACAAAKVPLVVGSTGFSQEGRERVRGYAQAVPMVLAPNTSVGVNVVIQLAGQLARLLGEGFDVEVLETHHRRKKDAPSGTALRIAEELAASLGRDTSAFRTSREGMTGERTDTEIGIQTLRGGDVVGEHTVFFYGDGERVELTHRATSREQFAKGALRAARWLIGRPAGLYDMMDVLGLRKG